MGTRLLERASLSGVAETTTADADLLVAVGRRDRAALEQLYERYSPRLFSLGLKLLGDGGLAEELVQETFVRLWRSNVSFDPAKGSASAFIFVIARRLAVDLWRRPSSRPMPPLSTTDGDADGAAVEDPVDAFVLAVVVRDALESLSPSHRDVLELAYRSDLTQRQIAARLEVPLGTVKTRAYYALRALKLALEERGIDA